MSLLKPKPKGSCVKSKVVLNEMDESVFEKCSRILAEKNYAVIDQFLTGEEVSAILAGLEQKYTHDKFKRAGIGQNAEHDVDTKVRGDFIYWIDPQHNLELNQCFIPYLNGLIKYLNRTCFLSITDFEMHYAVYPRGTFYKRHLDQFKTDDRRILTFILYLNFDWTEEDGGQLRIFIPRENEAEKVVDITPKAGRLVCFKSDLLEHEVLPTKKTRYSLTGWLKTRGTGMF